jgi:ATP/maltotriose-dependent transcriptional regulator MalT
MDNDRRVIDESTEFGARVARHMREEIVAWMTTVTPAGSPVPRPVWFVWDGAESVVMYSQPKNRIRNLDTYVLVRGLAGAECNPQPPRKQLAQRRGGLGQALIESGELDEAERSLRTSGYGELMPAGMASNSLLEARGLLQLSRGRAREALEDLTSFGRHNELWGAANPLASRWRSNASFALAMLGEREEARRMAAEDVELARRSGAASGIGISLRALALAEGGDEAVARLREAVAVLEDSPARLEHGRALTDLGAALRRTNRRSAARQALHEGLELAERCKARALVSRARTELRAAGGRSSDPHGSGVEQLTASEQRVAELAAQGLSNPEIAQALFVTRKTVETHLGHVYRKLDISGRGKLVHVLAETAASTS